MSCNSLGKPSVLHPVMFTTLLLMQPLPAAESIDSYLDLPLEDLLSMEVTSVAKKKQRLNEVAAAIFVITNEDIRRSGVTSIPEALRLAPGIQVARIDANKWAISSRGFNTQFANKLLVLIDGRTVYTPSYSGVYWDVQDTLLADIDRIEVIRGPGATLWGANAVNGVINIITRHASESRGGLLTAGGGNEEKTIASLRYGTELGADTHARVYLKYNARDSAYTPQTGQDAGDDWDSLRGGFRVDGAPSNQNRWTLQGDVYQADESQKLNLWRDPADPANAVYAPFYLAAHYPDDLESSGWNLLGRWDHFTADDSNTRLQVYYDHTKRQEAFITQEHDTLDIDFQHQFRLFQRHDLVWGLGYRHIQDAFHNTFNVSFIPDSQSADLASAFLQDEIELLPGRLHLTLGSKFEHNDYTGFEIQPSARLVWLPHEQSTLWASVSRAVRTPSRLEDGSRIAATIVPIPPTFTPLVVYTQGDEAFESEKLLAYEFGYRFQPLETVSFDLAAFYNDYDDLQNFERNALSLQQVFANKLSAHSYGIELVVDWRPLEWWRLQSAYSYIELTGKLDPDSTETVGVERLIEGAAPQHQLSLRSMMDLSEQVSLDLWLYHVGELERSSFSVEAPISAYTRLNARLAWVPRENLELSLIGHNLLDNRHMEFVGENLLIATEVERSVYGLVRWEF